MARRNIGGSGGEDADYAAFLAARQQPQSDPRMTLAMQIMGLMEKQQTAQQDRALEERKQQAQELYQSGQLGIEEAKRKTAETEAGSLQAAREAETSARIRQGMTEGQKEAVRQQEQAATLAANVEAKKQEVAKGVLGDLLQYGGLKPADPEYAQLREQATPGYGEAVQKAKGDIFNRQVQEGLAKFQGADEKAKKALAANPATLGGPEVYGEILKRAGVQVPAAGAPATSDAGLGTGIQDVLWNLPGGTENIFRWMANLGSRAWYGKGGPQYAYVPWTSANDEIPKLLGEGPPVAPPPAGPVPRPQYGNYGVQAGPAEAPPEWQYGVGQQRPPVPLNDLLAKALQNQ